MKKLTIIDINNKLYTLKDSNNQSYKLNLTFYDMNKSPKIGNIIYISNELLDKNYIEYSNNYCFGKITSEYGRNITIENNPDILIIEMDNNKEYLKRLYG